jgi:hypothetical protein
LSSELARLAVAIADGVDCLNDFEALRKQSELFGNVASVLTAWRAVKATSSTELRHIPPAPDKMTVLAAIVNGPPLTYTGSGTNDIIRPRDRHAQRYVNFWLQQDCRRVT